MIGQPVAHVELRNIWNDKQLPMECKKDQGWYQLIGEPVWHVDWLYRVRVPLDSDGQQLKVAVYEEFEITKILHYDGVLFIESDHGEVTIASLWNKPLTKVNALRELWNKEPFALEEFLAGTWVPVAGHPDWSRNIRMALPNDAVGMPIAVGCYASMDITHIGWDKDGILQVTVGGDYLFQGNELPLLSDHRYIMKSGGIYDTVDVKHIKGREIIRRLNHDR